MADDLSLRIAVLLGGESPEREISLASGICVAAALEEAGHRPRDIDPAEVDLRDVDWRQFDVAFIALHGGAGEDGRVQGQLEALGVRYTGSGPAASRRGMSKAASKRRFCECGVPTPPFFVVDAGKPIDAAAMQAAGPASAPAGASSSVTSRPGAPPGAPSASATTRGSAASSGSRKAS